VTLFADASALVAIMAAESEASHLETMLEADPVRLTSAIALWETSRAIAKLIRQPETVALDEVLRFCKSFGVVTVSIDLAEATEAARAQQLYGKGTGHTARLNMGDCFAYACAKTNGARLLYKGDDFTHTDVALT
jgi:ribonuclease VapC